MQSRTIAIIGAGPIGGILAARLILAGHRVLLVDSWKEHVEHMRRHGLHIIGREEATVHPEHLYTSIEELGEILPEFVFICTKGCDLKAVAEKMSMPLRQSRSFFISFQNGIDTEQILAERFGKARVFRGVISYAGVLTGPGEIRESFFNPPNYLGWLDSGSQDACKNAADILTACGMDTVPTEDIRRYAWRKTIFNTCIMAVAAVTGMNIQEMVEFPPTEQLADQLLEESIAVAAANGFDFGPEFAESVRTFHKRVGPHRPSMLVDIENGRKTENAFLVRRIAEYADLKGVSAPLHRTLATVIEALELRNLKHQGFTE
jgi:2-dehydropantoate 2-reductase